jgi:tRNA 5-methylaminomethyl-2-thiouridine biosynthesis bifunctional protein
MTSPLDPNRTLVSPALLAWDGDGVPRSETYGDVYFSVADGLAESRAVFLEGCGLPKAWADRSHFVVAELGFGTGLNILALLQLWQAQGPQNGHLHIFSIEAHPLTANEASRALNTWPELADLSAQLIAQWPGQARGFHRIDLPHLRVVIDVAVMEVEEALKSWAGSADAWFLDGFSPAVNPQMWRDEVLALVAARSAPGARVATFTVAGAVRRGLAAQGFNVDKRPGFGRKRERLEAVWPGLIQSEPRKVAPTVAVIGAGIAGAALVRAFKQAGVEVHLFEAEQAGAGASGNPAALMTPRLDAGAGVAGVLHAQAYRHALGVYHRETPQAILAEGVMQLETAPADSRRFDIIAEQDLFEPQDFERLDAAQSGERLGETALVGGLWMARALSLEPSSVLQAWLGPVTQGAVASLQRESEDQWILRDRQGAVLAKVDQVFVAAGAGANALLRDLPFVPVRGQASWTESDAIQTAAAWGGYAVPTRSGVLYGATHDRGETQTDIRADDNDRNRAVLEAGLPVLAGQLEGRAVQARASLRATVPDQLPVVGQMPDQPGLMVLGALGSRGFTLAPLLAEHLVAVTLGRASPLPRAVIKALEPGRFAERQRRRS